MPRPTVQPIETAELEPGSAVFGRGGEIVTQKLGRRAALSASVHRHGARGGAGIHRRLRSKPRCPGKAGRDEGGSESEA